MRRYLDLVLQKSNFLPVTLIEDGGNYTHDDKPIRWAWVGLCILAYRRNSFDVALIAPSKGAAYITQKKMARAIKRHPEVWGYNEAPIEPIKRPRIIPHLSSDMPTDEIEKIVKSSLLRSVSYDPQ